MDDNQNALDSVVGTNKRSESNHINNLTHIDWGKMKIYEQVSDKDADFDFYTNKGGQKGNWDVPITNRIPSEDVPQMIREFNLITPDKYEKHLFVTSEVARVLFERNEAVKIFLGENDEGLVLMCKELTPEGNDYYIINNCESIKEITREDFEKYRSFYDETLRSVLDAYIQERQRNTNACNTKRFTLENIVYNELVRQQELKPSANIVISLYPAMHLRDVFMATGNLLYKNRFTFIMVLEERNELDFNPIGDTGVFDRNGLCPPPNDSNC